MYRYAAFLLVLIPVVLPARQPNGTNPGKIYQVPKKGLIINGQLTKNDSPLAALKGAPHKIFRLELHKGQYCIIELASKDFDAFLFLYDAAGKRLAYDDDSGIGLNSRIAFRAGADGVYRLVAAALDKRIGAFQLKLRVGELSQEQKLAAVATQLDREGIRLYHDGQPAAAFGKWRHALEIHRKLYPASKYPAGHSNLATSLGNLGIALQAKGQLEKAYFLYQRALDMDRRLYAASKYRAGLPNLAISLNQLGTVLLAMGQAEKALPYFQESVAIQRRLNAESKYAVQPHLAGYLNNLGGALQAMGRTENALSVYQQSLDIYRRLYPMSKYPVGHPNLARSLGNLAGILQDMGQLEKAHAFYQRSLDMRRKLYPVSKYPNGHPGLAESLNNMGAVLEAMGQPGKAYSFFRLSLEMRRRLYPASNYRTGHPLLSATLNNMGYVMQKLGQADKALNYHQQSLEMERKLYPASKYPAGHPDLASSLNNLGGGLKALGQSEKSLSCYQQSLAMYRKLYPASMYPSGQPDLAQSMTNVGAVLYSMGQAKKALPFFQQSLVMRQGLLKRELLTAPEAAAFDRIAADPAGGNAYLSATRAVNTSAASVYRAIWPSRSMITRLLQQRHASARVAGTAAQKKIYELKANRRRTDSLLRDMRLKPKVRDKLLTNYADDRDKLERDLIAAIPLLKRWKELDQLGPNDLVKILPPRAVFIDLIAYTRFELDRTKKGKQAEKRIPSYVGFVLAKGQPIRRIELNDAKPINDAVAAWCKAINTLRDDRAAARRVRDLVWSKIRPHLPKGTKTIYLTADSDLARVPWAALPTGKNRVLLEDYALAIVPHGTFLLESLKYPRQYAGSKSALLVGGIDYNSKIWPNLPGTSREIGAIAKLARGGRETLSKVEATGKRLAKALPTARYAHLATHGFFDAETLTAEKKRAIEARKHLQFSNESRPIAAKNPLGFVGLVLANGEVMSGLSLVDLPLDNLKLVTLSACETGLGEYTGGEGVRGLQHAFHLAGCPNVVASLWQVNDESTAALMSVFYHELWVKKRTPIEALRTAQLYIYYNPGEVKTLVQRGPPRLGVVAVAPKVDPSRPRPRRADTKDWAAFVLSGLGR